MSNDTAAEAVVNRILDRLQQKFNLSTAYRQLLHKDVEELGESDGSEIERVVRQIDADIQKSPYWIESQVGSGAFGNVYKGSRKSDQQPVAIKVIDLENSRDDIQTINKEITTLVNAKSCPQLINYHGSLVFGTKLWIIMEFIDGGSLLDRIKKHGVLNETQVQIVVREVLLGLDYLQREGKVHRDIKAANILYSANTPNPIRLADFGASSQLTDTMTKCSTFVGSPFWMAPEVLLQNTYDGKADIWSLGITCYEMVTGAPPNSKLHPFKLVQLIPRAPVPQLPPSASSLFCDFFSTCLIKDPTQRPSIKELLKHEFVTTAPSPNTLFR